MAKQKNFYLVPQIQLVISHKQCLIIGQKVTKTIKKKLIYLTNYILHELLDWEAELVSKAEILRLIYQGRFLHCNVTLGALGLPLGKTTVMHLVPRDNLPEPNSQGM